MKYISFSNAEKIELFDEIASHFFNANFGQMSKSDFELMMFRFYIEKMIKLNRLEDGTIDYRQCSDYRISQDLGITQQRVKNLKIKNQLTHPIEYDWKIALSKLIANARYDKNTGKISMNIPDPNLYIEIQNFIEEQGSYVETQLNSKILQLRVEYFIDLVIGIEPEQSRKKIANELKKSFKDSIKEDTIFNENNIGKSLLDISANITTVFANISGLISPDNYLGVALFGLIKRTLGL